jgi:hypothetical protein
MSIIMVVFSRRSVGICRVEMSVVTGIELPDSTGVEVGPLPRGGHLKKSCEDRISEILFLSISQDKGSFSSLCLCLSLIHSTLCSCDTLSNLL